MMLHTLNSSLRYMQGALKSPRPSRYQLPANLTPIFTHCHSCTQRIRYNQLHQQPFKHPDNCVCFRFRRHRYYQEDRCLKCSTYFTRQAGRQFYISLIKRFVFSSSSQHLPSNANYLHSSKHLTAAASPLLHHKPPSDSFYSSSTYDVWHL